MQRWLRSFSLRSSHHPSRVPTESTNEYHPENDPFLRSDTDHDRTLEDPLLINSDINDNISSHENLEGGDRRPQSPTSKYRQQLQQFTMNREALSTSIVGSPNIPRGAKVVVPLLIIGNMMIFIWSNMSIGAEVWLRWTLFDIEAPATSMFNFSLVETVVTSYNARAYFLFGLVLIWSGIWPYMKLMLLLAAWFAPVNLLTAKTRNRLLLWMDFLGKWCIMDTFFMVMMSVAFRFHLDLFDDPALFVMNVDVMSSLGVYTFVVGSIFTLINSHIMLAYHKYAMNLSSITSGNPNFLRASSQYDFQHLERVKLAERQNMFRDLGWDYHPRRFLFACPTGSWFDVGSLVPNHTADRHQWLLRYLYVKEISFRKANKFIQIKIVFLHALIGISLVAAVVLIVVGANIDAFSFTYAGAAGEALGYIKPELLTRSFSLISVSESLSHNETGMVMNDFQKFGIHFLQGVFLIFALVMPLCLTIFLFALWFIPMNLRDQKIVYYVAEIVAAWSALDVFIVCVLAANMEISQFARFLLDGTCKLVEDFAANTTCFAVDTELLDGTYILATAAGLIMITSSLVVKFAEDSISARESLALIEINENEREESVRRRTFSQ